MLPRAVQEPFPTYDYGVPQEVERDAHFIGCNRRGYGKLVGFAVVRVPVLGEMQTDLQS